MQKKTRLTEASIYAIFILVAIFSFTFDASAQSVKQDANGNYIAVKQTSASDTAASYKPTGKTYTDTKGNTYPVMISNNGKLFVIRTSKNGNQYKQYLKL